MISYLGTSSGQKHKVATWYRSGRTNLATCLTVDFTQIRFTGGRKTLEKALNLPLTLQPDAEAIQLSTTYRVIHKSLLDFRPLRYGSRDGHAEGEHVNRGRDTPSFCPTLQLLDMSTFGDAADVNPVIKFLPHTLHVCDIYIYIYI